METICQNIKTDRNNYKQLANQFYLEFGKLKDNLIKVKDYFNDIDPELKKRLLGIVIEKEQYIQLKRAICEHKYNQVEKIITELGVSEKENRLLELNLVHSIQTNLIKCPDQILSSQ